MKLTWSWCLIFLMCCWIQPVSISLSNFASMLIKEIGLWFWFFVLDISTLGIRKILSS
jgi:hypothetical protein